MQSPLEIYKTPDRVYKMGELLGEGSFGSVRVGRSMRKWCAVKSFDIEIYTRHQQVDEEVHKSEEKTIIDVEAQKHAFETEKAIMMRLQELPNPNIIQCYGTSPFEIYLELCPMNLGMYLKTQMKKISLHKIQSWTKQLLSGLP